MFWRRKKEPYITFLPEPRDATIGVLREVVKQRADIPTFTVGLSSLEAPSAQLAIQLYQRERYGQANAIIEVADVQQPDPRIPHQPVDFVVWAYDGTRPYPTFEPPQDTVCQPISRLAQLPYNRQKWVDQARQVAEALGAHHARDLVAIMVHPPQRPSSFTTWNWLHHVQVAAGYVIGSLDQGWDSSIRKQYLFSLARGPMDWTVEAALLPLSYIAETETATTHDIAALYLELLQGLPRPGGVPYEHALLWSITRILEKITDPLQTQLAARFIAEVRPNGA